MYLDSNGLTCNFRHAQALVRPLGLVERPTRIVWEDSEGQLHFLGECGAGVGEMVREVEEGPHLYGLSAGHTPSHQGIRERRVEARPSLLAVIRVEHLEEDHLLLGHLGEVKPPVLAGVPRVQQILSHLVVLAIFLENGW